MIFNKALALTLLLLASAAANSATIWTPTDVVAGGNVNIIQVPSYGITLNGGTLALFQDTDTSFATPLALGSGGGIFEFTDLGSNSWKVEAFVGTVSQGSITMTGWEFSLGVKWGTGAYVGDSSYAQAGADPTSFVINFIDGANTGSTVAVDLTPIPLPAAAWLFGSALMGLLLVARRKA